MKNSVVMASYNGAKYIVTQLDSIKNQTMRPDEVIISDDGSTDDTLQIVKNYIAENHLSGWKVINNKRERGFFNNFFNALGFATGDIIYLADQDDVWNLNKIETFTKKYIECLDVIMIQSNVRFIDENGEKLNSREIYHNKTSKNDFTELSTRDMCKFAGSGYTMSFRKSVLDVIFKNKLDTQEELFKFHDIVIGLMSAATGCCLLSMDIVDSHRLHNDNATLSIKKKSWADRTKDIQLDILRRRKEYFSILSKYCTNENKKKYFKKCSLFAALRNKYINKFSFDLFLQLLKNNDFYANRLGIVTDTFYSLNQEKLLLRVYKFF